MTTLPSTFMSAAIARHWPWTMLVIRTVLFAAFQVVIAAFYALIGSPSAWPASAAWWMLAAALTNLVCIALLTRLYRDESSRFRDIFHFDRSHWKQDLLVLLVTLPVMTLAGFLPSILSANWLFGSFAAASELFVLPLPLWAAAALLILFPVTIALAELPTYFAYAMPRIEAQTGRRWLAVLLAAFFLAAQHCTMPLLFDGRFLLYRFLQFLPFALLLGILLRWRPRLLPYLVIIHGLLDFATAASVLSVSL